MNKITRRILIVLSVIGACVLSGILFCAIVPQCAMALNILCGYFYGVIAALEWE